MVSGNINAVFYAESYHPIQAGSIDGTDILPHDNAVYRAHLCSSAGLYDPFGDPKACGDPYCTVFVGHLSGLTTEGTLHKVMSKYGQVKNLCLVRDIVTGASRGYAFVQFETVKEMKRAYKEAHHSFVDDSEIIVDYSRQQLMPGWIPRRLGGGLGGKKESGQLRFGGRERPFRAPLRPIPYDDLKRLGIPPPPEGRYMSRSQVPCPPRREGTSLDREDDSCRRGSKDKTDEGGSMERTGRYRSRYREHLSHRRRSSERREERSDHYHKRSSTEKDEQRYRNSVDRAEHSQKRKERDEYSHRQQKYDLHSHYED